MYHSQDETSEIFIGEWMEKRGIRDQLVIATKVCHCSKPPSNFLPRTYLRLKYTGNYKKASQDIGQKTHYVGNNTKAMHLSAEDSLKKLRTSYIDIFYVHWWDYATSIEEVMNGLHHLVVQGKVLYLGISDTPAWVVSKANTYARLTNRTPFVIYQGAWSILSRDFERDIIPMALNEGQYFLNITTAHSYMDLAKC